MFRKPGNVCIAFYGTNAALKTETEICLWTFLRMTFLRSYKTPLSTCPTSYFLALVQGWWQLKLYRFQNTGCFMSQNAVLYESKWCMVVSVSFSLLFCWKSRYFVVWMRIAAGHLRILKEIPVFFCN